MTSVSATSVMKICKATIKPGIFNLWIQYEWKRLSYNRGIGDCVELWFWYVWILGAFFVEILEGHCVFCLDIV
jgi:hypothetical protein